MTTKSLNCTFHAYKTDPTEKKAPAALTDWGEKVIITKDIVTMTGQTIVSSKLQTQASKTWDRPTGQASIGDRFKVPCTPIMQVVDKEILEDGRVWLLVKPVSASYTEEWILDPEPAQPPQQQQPQQEKAEPIQTAGFAGDTVGVNLRPTHKAFATMAEWEEAAGLIPPGYRIKNGWFCDSHGGQCNLPPTKLSSRQLDILMGVIPVR